MEMRAGSGRDAPGAVVGIVPAAGRGTRIGPLPCSKEVFPVGFRAGRDGSPRPRPAAVHLLEKMAAAGASRAVVVLRQGKWDIPACLARDGSVALDLAYVVMRRPFGVPYSVDDAHAFVRDATVIFGFPDVLSRPEDLFGRLLEGLRSTGADVTVAVYPRRPGGAADGLALEEDGGIGAWETAPEEAFEHTWIAAAWSPAFTEFLHAFLESGRGDPRGEGARGKRGEMAMGEAFRAAMRAGLQVGTVLFEDGTYVDIGTPADLAEAVRDFAGAPRS